MLLERLVGIARQYVRSRYKIRFTSRAGTTGSTELARMGHSPSPAPFHLLPPTGDQQRLCPSHPGGHHHQRMGGQTSATSLSQTLPGWDLQWCEYSIIHPLMRGPTSPASAHTHRAIAGATCHQAPLITIHSTTVLHRTESQAHHLAYGLTRGPTALPMVLSTFGHYPLCAPLGRPLL